MNNIKPLCLALLCAISLPACTDGASVSAGSDGTSTGAAFDFSGRWSGTMTPNNNNSEARPANISLTITQNSTEVPVTPPDNDDEDDEDDDNPDATNTTITASGVASIDGKCWNGGPVSEGTPAGTTVTFKVTEADNKDATTTFSGQFLGDRIEGSFTSSGGECETVSGSWTVTR